VRTVDHEVLYCPYCQHPAGSSTQFFASRHIGPRPGDIAFCHHCQALVTYALVLTKLVLVRLSPEREVEAECDPRIIAMRAAWLDLHHGDGRR
jgi:hypothetical protein